MNATCMTSYMEPSGFCCSLRKAQSISKPKLELLKGAAAEGFDFIDFLSNMNLCTKYDLNIELKAGQTTPTELSKGVCDDADNTASHVMDDASYCSSFHEECLNKQATVKESKNDLGNEEPANSWVEGLFENKDDDKHEMHNRELIFWHMDKLFPQMLYSLKNRIEIDFAIHELTWIQTLKNRYSYVENILNLLDSRIRFRGCKGGARVQSKKKKP